MLAQTWLEWHLTVSDDGSKDSTVAILNEYTTRYPGRISRIFANQTFGNAKDHFFWLMERCESSYMMFCDQDDVWHTDKVEKTINTLLQAEATYGSEVLLLIFTDAVPVNEKLCPLAPSLMKYQKHHPENVSDFRRILLQNVVSGCTIGINRPLAKKALQCTDRIDVIMHDSWLAAVAARFGHVVYIGEATLDYRQHGDNSVGAKNTQSLQFIIEHLSNLKQSRMKFLMKKRQASVFANTYEFGLEQQEREYLHLFSKDRSGPLFYWKNRSLFSNLG